MPTKLEIYNAALASVNAATLSNENQDTAEGQAVRAIFPIHFQALIPLAKWQWAKKRATIASPDATAPVGGDYTQQYSLPSDFVRMVGVLAPSAPPSWEVEADKLLVSDDNGVTILYLSNADGVLAFMDGAAARLLQISIGIDLATRFMRNEEMARRLQVQYNLHLQLALNSVQDFVDLPAINLESALLAPGQPRAVTQ